MRPEWLLRALDFQGYLREADMNVPTMKKNFEDTRVNEEDHVYFHWLDQKLSQDSVTVVAFSESWCGDCVENLPIIARLAHDYGFLNLVVFPRDVNLDIMDQLLNQDKRAIPAFILYDGDKEIGRFIERPPGAHEFMRKGLERIENLPEAEKQRARYKLRADLRKEYAKGLRNETIKVIRRILEEHYGTKDS
jgi:thiol-disulfide isomerase/thioredoxin